MRVSHLLYKAENLEQTFKAFEQQGYKVAYGSKKKPHNALIYFSEGPYIELLEKAPVSKFIKTILRVIGKNKVVERFDLWEKAEQGFFEICLETNRKDLKVEEQLLKHFNEDYFVTKSKRRDPLNRLLKWKLLFPYNLKIPFLMTYFNQCPKPKNFTHPNGVKKIKSLSYGIDLKNKEIISALCDDEILELHEGTGIKNIQYQK